MGDDRRRKRLIVDKKLQVGMSLHIVGFVYLYLVLFALLANFGASDEAVLDVIFGRFNPSATLPFEMPSSMEAVEQQLEDVPYDSKDPLFKFGFGLRYDEESFLDDGDGD